MLRVKFTVSTMSDASCVPIAGVPANRGKRILLPATVWFLMGTENSAALVLS